nr:uncharacterized protein LOC111513706 [Leptinotarsa decemlineata]
MAKYLLESCCACGSLRTGTIVSGISAIILSIIGIIVVLAVRVELITLVFDWLPKWIVQVIIILNMIMTIILSSVMLIGVFRRNWYLMIPWIVLGGMLSIGLLVSVLMTSIHFYIDGDTLNGTLWMVLGLISFVVYCYMWYVSFSFFANLREESERGAYSKDPFRRQRM